MLQSSCTVSPFWYVCVPRVQGHWLSGTHLPPASAVPGGQKQPSRHSLDEHCLLSASHVPEHEEPHSEYTLPSGHDTAGGENENRIRYMNQKNQKKEASSRQTLDEHCFLSASHVPEH